MRKILLLTVCSCLPAPTLGEIVGRIDVARAIECAQQPTPRDKARCLGVSLLTDGIDLALGEAARAGDAALRALAPTGADDLTPADRRRIAREADRALDALAIELARAEAP